MLECCLMSFVVLDGIWIGGYGFWDCGGGGVGLLGAGVFRRDVCKVVRKEVLGRGEVEVWCGCCWGFSLFYVNFWSWGGFLVLF